MLVMSWANGQGPWRGMHLPSKTEAMTAHVEGHATLFLSQLLLQAARDCAADCDRVEREEFELDWPQSHYEISMRQAASAVVMSAAALEASINEFYLQAVAGNQTVVSSATAAQVSILAQLWEALEESKANTLAKHQVAVTALGRRELDRGSEPYQSASNVFRLRNLIVHFKPERDDELDQQAKLEAAIAGKFKPNRLFERAPGRVLWFPALCLGAGCAAWAWHSIYAFHLGFANAIGMEPRLAAR